MVTTPWLGLSETALWALTLVNAWHWVGFPTLVFLAGIQRIPPDIIEASRIDGVNEWQLVTPHRLAAGRAERHGRVHPAVHRRVQLV